jgi:hypothetical protein
MDKKEYDKLRKEKLKLSGLCTHCGKINMEKTGFLCTRCRDVRKAYRIYKKDTSHLECSNCYKPKQDFSKSMCSSCLEKSKLSSSLRRQSQSGKWVWRVRSYSGMVAKGFSCGKSRLSSHYLPWTHQDFCKAFPAYKDSGKHIDHIISLVCAESSQGQLDMEFGKLAARLENIQLLTPSENVKKGKNIDRQMKARAIALRQQGKHGAELFHQLWAEFAYPQRQE